jgi:hypothetical protein
MNRLWALLSISSVMLLVAACEREKDRLDAEVRLLCARDGGVKVSEKVILPARSFDKFGAVSIPSKEMAKPEDDYYYERHVEYIRRGNPELLRSRHLLIRRKDGKVLGESVRYTRRGGDMPGPWHESSFSCPEIGSQQALEKVVFVKE